MKSIIAFIISSASIGYALGFMYAFIAYDELLKIFMTGIVMTGPIGMMWGGIIGILFVAVQAAVILPTTPRFVSSQSRRSFYDSMVALMKKISALAFIILGPFFVGYVLTVILAFVGADMAHQDSGQVGIGALFIIGPIGMIIGGAIGILYVVIKFFRKQR